LREVSDHARIDDISYHKGYFTQVFYLKTTPLSVKSFFVECLWNLLWGQINFFIFSVVSHKTGIIRNIVYSSVLHGVLMMIDMSEQFSGPQEHDKL
jgi:hypothetical protein